MSAIEFHAMGTTWWIHCNLPDHLAEVEARVRTLESRLSRFRADSALSRLNRQRRATCPTLAAVTRLALGFRAATDGAFDPLLGAELAALGYDRSFEHIGPRVATRTPSGRLFHTYVTVDGDEVHLDGPGHLDLGGVAKGYAVDQAVALLLERGAKSVLVDGGGDLRGAGPSFPIGVGDGLVVQSRAGAIATSSTLQRCWLGADDQVRHHIVDPHTGLPSDTSIDTATVVAPDAVTADALATALIVDPDSILARLSDFAAHALVRARDGHWWHSPGAPIAAYTSLTCASSATLQNKFMSSSPGQVELT